MSVFPSSPATTGLGEFDCTSGASGIGLRVGNVEINVEICILLKLVGEVVDGVAEHASCSGVSCSDAEVVTIANGDGRGRGRGCGHGCWATDSELDEEAKTECE